MKAILSTCTSELALLMCAVLVVLFGPRRSQCCVSHYLCVFTCCRITDYIRCRKAELKQHPPPPGGATDSLQRLQLMNLGYDPLKDSEVADCWTYNSI